MPNQAIFQQDSANEEPKLYLIMKGNVEIYQSSRHLKIMNKKDIFKSMKLLTANSMNNHNHSKLDQLKSIKETMYKTLQKQLYITKKKTNHSQREIFPLCTLK